MLLMSKYFLVLLLFLLTVGSIICPVMGSDAASSSNQVTVTDSFGREVTIPADPERIAVNGMGGMRYFTYLGIDPGRFVGVDMSDSSESGYITDPRPYIIAHPEILKIAPTGSKSGVADAEKIMSLNPDVLFIAGSSPDNVQAANEIQEKTGIPTVLFYSGIYADEPEKVKKSLEMISSIFGTETRCKELIAYFDAVNADIQKRVSSVPSSEERVYICGVSYRGEHGTDGTNPNYLPFTLLKANNVAKDVAPSGVTDYATVTKEQIVAWDPQVIFVSLGTQNAANGGAISELKSDPSYSGMTAVQKGEVFGLIPENSMGSNYENALANSYFVGKILYPDQFTDIDPAKKADEIFTKVDGGSAFDQINKNEQGLVYQKIKF